MTSKHDIGWEHVEPVCGNRRTINYKYYDKVIHRGRVRLKQRIAYISKQVKRCSRVPTEVLLDYLCLMFQKKKLN